MTGKLGWVLDLVEVWAGAVALLVSLFLTAYAVVARYVFSAPVNWPDEPIIWLVAWAVFLSASRNLRDNEHIGVDLFVNAAPPALRRAIRIVTSLLILTYAVTLLVFGVAACLQTQKTGLVTNVLRVPLWSLQAVVPLAGGLLVFRCLEQLWLLIRYPQRLLERAEIASAEVP